MRWSSALLLPALLLSLLSLVASACARPSPRGEARAREVELPTPSENACTTCHPAEVADWRGSSHQRSFVNTEFQRSYQTEHRAYCADCHAPLRTSDGARDVASGIGCVACHAVDERHLSAGGGSVGVTTTACASCHDFDAPGSRAVLQSTAREHAASAFASTACEECHMTARGRRRDHSFQVRRDLVAGALRVGRARLQGGDVVVTLRTHDVGHRFPTGDLFRRVTVTLTVHDEDGAVLAGDTIHLHRDWDAHRASLRSGAEEDFERDTRLTDEPREFRVACKRRPARVHLTAVYERGASAEGDFFEAFEAVEILDTDVDVTDAR